ncbi:MAG TPA: alpha-amylase/4-alpha-glucanotransferase domain-containing protein, partial [Candidatus Polarisedimenticolia bacterium]|nr:alpha-amylase/4-alpha-glucanotransferase domain-containing protein [Candidatus Polarisedimenticolia bacterium]
PGGAGPAPAGGGGPPAGWFGTLLCLSLLTRKAPDRALAIETGQDGASRHAPGDALEARGVSRIVFEDRAFGFALDLAPRPGARLITAPIETLQRSEDRYEAAYQGTLVALCWSLESIAGIGDGPALVLSFRPIPREELG